jgi:hypothetical protein
MSFYYVAYLRNDYSVLLLRGYLKFSPGEPQCMQVLNRSSQAKFDGMKKV